MNVRSVSNPLEWLKRGGDYLKAAKIVLKEATDVSAPVAHDAWMAAEDSLKALSTRPVVQTHDLGVIINHLRDNGRITSTEISEIAPSLTAVTGSNTYTATKYPESDPVFWESRTPQQMGDTVQGAERIYLFVRGKLGLSVLIH